VWQAGGSGQSYLHESCEACAGGERLTASQHVPHFHIGSMRADDVDADDLSSTRRRDARVVRLDATAPELLRIYVCFATGHSH